MRKKKANHSLRLQLRISENKYTRREEIVLKLQLMLNVLFYFSRRVHNQIAFTLVSFMVKWNHSTRESSERARLRERERVTTTTKDEWDDEVMQTIDCRNRWRIRKILLRSRWPKSTEKEKETRALVLVLHQKIKQSIESTNTRCTHSFTYI